MSTSRRRSIISMLVRSDEPGEPLYVPGGSAAVAAFNARDADALKAVLGEHPGAWKTEMPWHPKQRAPRLVQYCMTVKMAVALNWAKGLEVLLSHGADPDARHDARDTTALDIAVRLARPSLARRLLTAGARFRDDTPASSIRMMFAKEYSVSRIEKCWKVMDALADSNISMWTAGPGPGRADDGVLLGLLDCYTHPDGGVAQAISLLEKFPVPTAHRPAVAAKIAANLGHATQLWERTGQFHDAAQVEKLFETMAAQGILPSPVVFVSTAVEQWGQPESNAREVHAWIREMLLLRASTCDDTHARTILDDFTDHPCLAGALGARLSWLALQQSSPPGPGSMPRPRF